MKKGVKSEICGYTFFNVNIYTTKFIYIYIIKNEYG